MTKTFWLSWVKLVSWKIIGKHYNYSYTPQYQSINSPIYSYMLCFDTQENNKKLQTEVCCWETTYSKLNLLGFDRVIP